MVKCYTAFPSSSVVEQPAVNRRVVGSNPTWGANSFLSGRVPTPSGLTGWSSTTMLDHYTQAMREKGAIEAFREFNPFPET